MRHSIVVQRHPGAPLFTYRRPYKPETARYTLRRAPSTRRRPREELSSATVPAYIGASQTRRSAPFSRRRPHEATRIYRCSCLVSNQRRPQMRRSALSTWRRPHELAPSAIAPVKCLPFGASIKWRSTLFSQWRSREAADICHYPCLVPTYQCFLKVSKRLIYPRRPRRVAPLPPPTVNA